MEAIDYDDTFFIAFPREITRAPLGAISDAIQSIFFFVDKSEDELKKQVNNALGNPTPAWEDPKQTVYKSWYKESNRLVRENQTAVGKLIRLIGKVFVVIILLRFFLF